MILNHVTSWVGHRLPKNRFARNVFLMAGGTAMAQALSALASPILTRLYRPEDFGVLSVYASMSAILIGIASLKYELAFPLQKEERSASHLLALCMGMITLMCCVTGIGFWVLAGPLTSRYPELSGISWLLPIGMFGGGLYQALNYWAIRNGDFKHLARTQVTQSVWQVLVQLALGVRQAGAFGLVAGQLFGQANGSGVLGRRVWDATGKLKGVTAAGIWAVAREHWRFPLISGPSGLMNSLGLYLPPVLFAAFYGPEIGGYFALSQRILVLPMRLVGRSIAQAYLGEMSTLYREDPAALRKLFLSTAYKLTLGGGLPVAILGLGGPWLFSLLFGQRWLDTGTYVRMMGLMFLVQFVVNPLSQTLTIVQRLNWQFAWDLGRLVLVIGSMVAAHWLGFSATAFTAVYSITMAVAYAVLFGLSLLAVSQPRNP